MPMHPDWPTIRSEGPPPERHADRVISEMTRWMYDDLLKFGPWMEALFNSADVGSPKAQQRLVDRLRKLGVPALLSVGLQPDKRGIFALVLFCWDVPDRERPQIGVHQVIVKGLGGLSPSGGFRRDMESSRLFLVSRHALSRLAQRASVRTPDDLHAALLAMVRAVIDAIMANKWVNDGASPPEGWRLPFRGGVAVLRRDGKAEGHDLIVATVLPNDRE